MYDGPWDLGFGPAQVATNVPATDHHTTPQHPEKLARGKDKFLVTPPLSHSHKGTPQTIAMQEKTSNGFGIKKAKSTEKQRSPKKMPFFPLYENVWKWVGISSLSTTHTTSVLIIKNPSPSLFLTFIYMSLAGETFHLLIHCSSSFSFCCVKKICGAKGLLLPCFLLF